MDDAPHVPGFLFFSALAGTLSPQMPPPRPVAAGARPPRLDRVRPVCVVHPYREALLP